MDDNLQSLSKLQNDIKSAKLISWLLPREQRHKLKEIENQLDHISKSISLFNKYFSDAGWCSYDSMNMPLIEQSIKSYETDGIDAGEKVLIEYYKTNVKDIVHWFKYKSKPYMERYSLIQKAFEDHFAGRYYA